MVAIQRIDKQNITLIKSEMEKQIVVCFVFLLGKCRPNDNLSEHAKNKSEPGRKKKRHTFINIWWQTTDKHFSRKLFTVVRTLRMWGRARWGSNL